MLFGNYFEPFIIIPHVRTLHGFKAAIEVIIFSVCRVLPPPVAWAQRKNVVFLTICVEDCREPTITIEDSKIYFKGTGGAEKKDYEYTYNLFKDIDAEVSTMGCLLFNYFVFMLDELQIEMSNMVIYHQLQKCNPLDMLCLVIVGIIYFRKAVASFVTET